MKKIINNKIKKTKKLDQKIKIQGWENYKVRLKYFNKLQKVIRLQHHKIKTKVQKLKIVVTYQKIKKREILFLVVNQTIILQKIVLLLYGESLDLQQKKVYLKIKIKE